ncbi:hypothetical protein BRADI_1g49250v3, partial [Brachypodium distachyon]
RSRDAVTGLAAFRSEALLVFPLSRGWCLVLDARDASCHLSHLATGATAALPKLTAVCRADRRGGIITHDQGRYYLHYTDKESGRGSRSSHLWGPGEKIRIGCPGFWVWGFSTYLAFTEYMRFAVHVPPAGADQGGMLIMMYHALLGPTGMVFCRPGDAAWTKVEKPRPEVGAFGFIDFAYHAGKVFVLESDGILTVFDATTLDVLCLVQPPPPAALALLPTFLFELEYQVHLVALPSKLVLVRVTVKWSRPVAFDLFELAAGGQCWRKVADAGDYELFLDGYHASFRENAHGISGTRIYYVYCYHLVSSTAACFYSMAGTPIYYAHDQRWVLNNAAYCYSMQDNKLECVYTWPPPLDQVNNYSYRTPVDNYVISTKPSWFVP